MRGRWVDRGVVGRRRQRQGRDGAQGVEGDTQTRRRRKQSKYCGGQETAERSRARRGRGGGGLRLVHWVKARAASGQSKSRPEGGP